MRTPPAPAPSPATTITLSPQDIQAERLTTGSRDPGTDDCHTPAQEISLVKYTVKSGDTLSSIAKQFNTSSDSIAHINGIVSPDRISVGKELSVMQNGVGTVVKVQSGDTLSGISSKYAVPVDDIVLVNGLDGPDDIAVGQILLLPGATVTRSLQILSRSSSFTWPAKGPVSSSFGWRIHPVSGQSSHHDGIDIAASQGSNVYAAASGEVTFADWYAGYGRLITIDHGGGIETWYGHLSGFVASEGDRVYAGDIIGYVGQSGTATGPNLHFEVRKNGDPVNPRDYLP
ncbi:MAG: peptidoglycan DD-metalloendopeptidase family protein [Bacillota bacterium]